MRKSNFAAALILWVSLFSVSYSRAAIVGEWDADDFTGGANWAGTADATVREGTPTSGRDSASFPGRDLGFITFGPAETAFEVAAADNALVGLAQFSASVVFRTTGAGANGENDFWRNQGLVGIELPGGGVGDWGVGIAIGGAINGGSALGGDTGSLGPAVNDGEWHVVTMTIEDRGDGIHDRLLYLDGNEVASDLGIAYGGGSSVVASSSIFFGDHQPGDAGAQNFQGDIAHIRLDDVPLSAAEITTAHNELLGTLVFVDDRDEDGMPDLWEEMFDLNPDDPADADGNLDADSLTNLQEFTNGTDPTDEDTDDDGLNDDVEVNDTETDPADADSDNDGLDDGNEVVRGTNPKLVDSDGDGFGDGEEIARGSDPTDINSVPDSLVAHWHSDDVPEGAIATWTERIQSIDAAGLGATGPTRDAMGIFFDGVDAGFEVAAANNPLGGKAKFTLTSVFIVQQGASRRGADTTNTFWANSMLVGRELPGGNRGDYGLAINSENELIAGWGQPDGGVLHNDVALNDGEVHVASAALEVGVGISLYVDGTLVNTTDNNGRAMEQETMNFGFNILGIANDSAYYTGHIQQIILHESALQLGQVEQLHASALSGGGLGFRITDIQFDPGGGAGGIGEISLTWASRPGATYAVFLSTDLIDWGIDIDDSVSSQGESTTLTFDHPMPGAARVYFRVEQ